MPLDKTRTNNFLYGGRSQNPKQISASKCSFWPSKPAAQKQARSSQGPGETNSRDRDDTRSQTNTSATTRNRNTQARSSRHQPVRDRDSVLPSRPVAPLTMHPFGRLASTVQQCPWMLGSGTACPTSPAPPNNFDDLYYPPVPRSLPHDTAVSFLVTDHTRPSQPRFVISCPLEHVDLIHGTLAPAGSRRVLSARGSSGQPRAGDQLRSMLLDGTPNIELALHARSVGGDVGGRTGGVGGDRDGSTGERAARGGSSNPPARSFSRRPSTAPGPGPGPGPGNANVEEGWPPEKGGGGPPGFVPMTWIPGVPVPQPGLSGWYGSPPPPGPGAFGVPPRSPPPFTNP